MREGLKLPRKMFKIALQEENGENIDENFLLVDENLGINKDQILFLLVEKMFVHGVNYKNEEII